MAYQTTSIYREKIYNEDARHKLKILFNGVEYPNIDNVCEKLTINSRIIPNGNTNFALDNFISKEATLILHNVALEDIVDPVEIQIGTLTGSDSLGDIYEYVPIGIFNIQDIPTTDKDKTTITLRDNAVKFDFPYNAEPLIEGNGGSATKMQIFQDICTQAGVNTNVSSFLKDDELFGGYDNTISGRQYIAYLAEQAGAIAIINRYGNLDFIYLSNLVEQEIPLQFVEKYENGDPIKISRVAYEDAKRKFEHPTIEQSQYDTLYINSANPYISSQEQIDDIYDIVNNFEINSFKTGKILGNPAIDPYDIISVHDKSVNLFDKDNANIINGFINQDRNIIQLSQTTYSIYIPCKPNATYTVSKMLQPTQSSNRLGVATSQTIPTVNGNINTLVRYVDGTTNTTTTVTTNNDAIYLIVMVYRNDDDLTLDELLASVQIEEGSIATKYVPYKDETYKTLATNTLTYNGKLIQTFDTQVKIGNKQSNVSLMSEPTFQKYAKTNFDNINNNIETIVAQQNETTQQMSQVIQTVNSIQNTFQVTGGNNLIKDSQGLLGDDVWTKLDGGNYVMGYDASLIGKTIAYAKLGVNNGKLTSTSENITGLVVGMQYTLSYKISNDANTTIRVKLTGNNVVYDDTISNEIEFVEKSFSFIADTSTYTLEIESTTTMDGYGYIYDLMLNKGDALSWEPASGEIVGTVLKMSQMGLQINCTGSDIATLMTSQGFQVRRYSNGTLYEIVTEFTSSGLKTKKAEMTELLINNFEWKQIRYQYNDTLILYKKESD